ncbi:MAG: hypothetical protein IJS39_09960 [Synergistaceae bacterium]|nr:hypothetical protein [Synergistaceae bacterium]
MMKLNEEQKQSLITSLLGFVRRVSFHGADSPEEAQALPVIVGMLLGMAASIGAETCEEESESDCVRESENSGTCHERECCCCRCFECTE